MKRPFSKLSDVINESVLPQTFGQALDKCMFFEFWKNIAGKKFEKISRAYDLKNGVLFVSVANAAAAQELSFFKSDLIQKSAPYASELKLTVSDIHFNYKNWHELQGGASKAFEKDYFEPFNDEDYAYVALTKEEEKEFEELKKSIQNNEFLPEQTREKFYNNLLKQYKAKKLRQL